MTRTTLFRNSISIFLLFHLFGVLITPNPRSYVTTTLKGIYEPYMATLGLKHTWGFFAPEPVAPPMYIDYIGDRKGQLPLEGRFPHEKNPFFFRDRYNRRLSMSRFIMSTDENIRHMFVRYLCLTNESLTSARLWRVIGTGPSVDDVASGKRRVTDPVDFKIDPLGTYYCTEDMR